MTRADEPPDWALPSWDAIDTRSVVPRQAAQAARDRPPAEREAAPTAGLSLRILGVSEVTRAIRDALRVDERLRDVWVEGEVGRVTISSAGHAYFTLKDERAQLSCIMFREDREASPFEPRTGLRVVAHGRIDVFEPGGVYQLYVTAIQPAGFGELALRYEALKAALAAEGLFDAGRKRALPVRPATIGVVTSSTGAVWHDIRTVVMRRWPLAQLLFVPCQVQGDGAAQSIVAALRRLDRWTEGCRAEGRDEDAPAVTILARGGGSLEDLWSFNDERVVRAVVAHRVPVVCGVGHETDVTLADFAADVRAPTPSAAAELVVPDGREIALGVDARRAALDAILLGRLARVGRELDAERRALDRLRPAAQLAAARERVGFLLDRATRVLVERALGGRRADQRAAERLAPAALARIARGAARLERSSARLPVIADARLASAASSLGAAAASLAALGPGATLGRGYAIVRRTDDGTIVRRPAEAPRGTSLAVDLADGRLAATSDGPIAGTSDARGRST